MDFKDLGITINHILRYAYNGLIITVIGVAVEPILTKTLIDNLGGVLAPIVVIAIGAAFYSFYKPVLNEIVIANLYEFFHKYQQKSNMKRSISLCTCKTYYLQNEFKVKAQFRWTAYRIIRDQLLNKQYPEMAKRFELQHSEIHLLFLTATLLFLAILYLVVYQISNGWCKYDITLILSACFLTLSWFGIRADMSICEYECAYLHLLKRDDISELLSRAQFIQNYNSITKLNESPAP
jgi:hypothetical protein